jgi:hypothetical protein
MTQDREGRKNQQVLQSAVTWLLLFAGIFLTGCAWVPFMKREGPRPGRTKLDSPLVVLPAQTLGNYLIVEAKWDRSGPYHFIIDTGSTVTLITPDLAKRYPGPEPARPLPAMPVKTAGGEAILLPQASMRRLQLGDARFENVPVLLYDCAALSAHLGVKIDGILGFPLFRETILTLDYPRSRVLLAPSFNAPLQPGTTIPFNNTNKKPLIPIRLGDTSFAALVDSGSYSTLRLNPIGLSPNFAVRPRAGGVVATLTGDDQQQIGRLGDSVGIGGYTVRQPLVEITDDLSAIGGGLLQHFTVSFDQERSRITFYREVPEPVVFRPLRSVGVSFSKTPAYWRVVGVVRDPAVPAPDVQTGDLVTRINGEPVAKWDYARYERLIATAPEVRFAFLNGSAETEKTLRVFELVP